MEKQAKQMNKILKFLPRAASAVNFRNQLPFSPGRDKRSSDIKAAAHASSKGYSGPIFKMIPDEVRRKPKNRGGGGGGGFDNQAEEPTSPKVSCIGQIKHKKTNKMGKSMSVRATPQETKAAVKVAVKKQESSRIASLLFGNNKKKSAGTERKSDASNYDKPRLPDTAPAGGGGGGGLGQMRRFASGRDTFANFDWTAHIEQEVHSDPESRRDPIYPHDDDEEGSEMDDDQEEYEEFLIPFSAPLSLPGDGERALQLQPRNEINLWKRRTMNPPRPLELTSTVRPGKIMTP